MGRLFLYLGGSMGKPFKTIAQQVELLEKRGVTTDGQTPTILLSEGYYSVVNGYKAPFIDPAASALAKDDRYVQGTRFADLYALFLFDRDLRQRTFRYLLKVETLMRTLCAYRFSEQHQERNAYLRVANYATADEYLLGTDQYDNDLTGLINILKVKSRDRNNSVDYIDHYRDTHGCVPLWVLVNALTFGNIEHFFDLMKPSEQRSVCKDVASLTGRLGSKRTGYFDPRRARICLETLVKYRNLCAHDERLYCARTGPHKDVDYSEFLRRIAPFLSDEDYASLITGVLELISRYSRENPGVGHVLDSMGFGRVPDIGAALPDADSDANHEGGRD